MDNEELNKIAENADKSKPIVNLKKMSGRQKTLLVIGVVAAVILMIWVIDVPVGISAGLPSLLSKKGNTSSNLPSLWISYGNSSLPHLVTYGKQTENPVTIEDILCDNIYRYNQANMSLADTTCFNGIHYNFTTTNECFCYTSI